LRKKASKIEVLMANGRGAKKDKTISAITEEYLTGIV
jgi:hypothetical protein